MLRTLNLNIQHKTTLSLAKLTPGYTAADLELVLKEICRESCIASELFVNYILFTIYLLFI
jgi:hypothetical protein